MAKFERPILHGLCSFGICTRAVYEKFCLKKPNMIKDIKCRFVSFVYPGETYSVKMWKEGKEVLFEAWIIERKSKVVEGSVELNDDKARI